MEQAVDRSIEESAIVRRLGGRLAVIRLDEIEVVDRYRVAYGDLEEFAESFRTKGQLQNIVVCTNSSDSAQPYRLLAGGRRHKTMSEVLQWEECNALIFDQELTQLELLEIEWEENKDRKSLSWQEECAIKAKIHELKIMQHGQKIGKTEDSPGISMRDVAKELGISVGTLSMDTAIHKAVQAAPQLFEGCKSKKDARKILSIASEAAIRAELAKRTMEDARQKNGTSRVKSLADRYIIRDCLEGMKEVPDGSINLVEIDPPYAISLQDAKVDFGNRYNPNDYNEIDVRDYINFLESLLTECKRTMAEHSWGILWHAVEWREIIFNMLTKKYGFWTTLLTGKWVKPIGQCKRPEKTLANACEEFFYFAKGEPVIVRQGHTNIFTYTGIASQKKIHPTERPIELIQDILSTFCWEGARIMVPCLGSGKTILAAEKLGMSAFGFDISAGYKDAYILQAQELFGS